MAIVWRNTIKQQLAFCMALQCPVVWMSLDFDGSTGRLVSDPAAAAPRKTDLEADDVEWARGSSSPPAATCSETATPPRLGVWPAAAWPWACALS